MLGPEIGLRQSIFLASAINVILLLSQLREVRFKPILMMSAVSLVTTPLFIWGRRFAHVDLMSGLAALATLAGIGMIAFGIQRRWMGTWAGGVLAGAMGALMNAVAGIAGPPAVLHAVSAGWKPQTIRSSLQLYFLAINVVALAFLGLPVFDLRLLSALGAGLVFGYLISALVDERWMRAATLVLAAVGASAAATRAFA